MEGFHMHLLTGATGYIGGRLLRRLESSGAAVRCLCRNPEALDWRVLPSTELVRGDLLQPASLGGVFSGVDTAFYLVHSMNGGEAFEAEERGRGFQLRDGGATGRSPANYLPRRVRRMEKRFLPTCAAGPRPGTFCARAAFR